MVYDVDGGELASKDVLKALKDKDNTADINEAMRFAEIGKGNDPVLGAVAVAAMTATAQPSGKPTKHTLEPSSKPVGRPSRMPTLAPTVYLEPGSKVMVVKLQIQGVTKRAGSWKSEVRAFSWMNEATPRSHPCSVR